MRVRLTVHNRKDNSTMLTKIKCGFRGRHQTPLFMIWKEYYKQDEVVYAKCLFIINIPSDWKQYGIFSR